MDIPTVATKSGEENLECVMKIRAKLFRWRDEQWKERGIGNAKLMRDRSEKQIRFVMRQEKTLKPVANHFILEAPMCVLTMMANNDKAYVWFVNDFADGEASMTKFALRFRTTEEASAFKAAMEAAQKFNDDAKAGKDDELVWAEAIEDIEEKLEDDIDTNKTADEEGGDQQ